MTENSESTTQIILNNGDKVEVTDGIKSYNQFSDMNLKMNLLRGIHSYGFEEPSSIQGLAIVPMTEKRDVIAQAQSGKGKTGAFTIGSLQIINEQIKECQCIIISNTHELANQTSNVISHLGSYLGIKPTLCIGGISLKENKEKLDNGSQIMVGTPGRICDIIINRNYIDTRKIKLLVLDEADELLMGDFRKNMQELVAHLPNSLQICLFSATFTDEILSLASLFMRNPVKILVKKEELTLEGIAQFQIIMKNDSIKIITLCDLYHKISMSQTMIYVNTKDRANWLQKRLSEDNFIVAIIHSEMTTQQRSEILEKFKMGGYRILISTDLLARGIDVQQVGIVINYDIPNNFENYLHRIGRSGRYGKRGLAINFVLEKELSKITEIENHFGIKITEMPANINEYIC